jgi:uncharacterized cupredoxin-like copper-binding protein
VRRVSVLLIAVALLSLAACGSSSKSNSSGGDDTTTTAATKARPHVTITATDFAYTLPDTPIPAGWVDVTLHNEGKTGHQIAFAKLGSVSFAAFKAAAVATDVKKLADVQFVGGPNNADPGGSVTATIHLEPGTYGVACFIPADSDGKSHAEHGMIGQVTVTQSPDSVDTAPQVDGGTITLSEFTFQTDASFTGTGTVAIKNVGTQLHEAIIVKEAEGATFDKVTAFFLTPPGTPPPSGPPPFTSAGGIVGLGPNQTMYQTMALTPGKYVMLCFFPDPTKGNQPHALEGMVKEITVS